MKNFITLIVALVFTLGATAQTAEEYFEIERDALKMDKKAMIKRAVFLTKEESAVFWPFYEEFNQKLGEIRMEEYQLIIDYTNNMNTLSGKDAESMWKKKLSIDQARLDLNRKYFKKLLNKIDGSKAVRYFQAEAKIQNMVDAHVSSEVPLYVDPKSVK